MDKKEALVILIKNSIILGEATQEKLLNLVDKMTDEEIMEWGKLLAEEQDFVEENKEEILAKLEAMEE